MSGAVPERSAQRGSEAAGPSEQPYGDLTRLNRDGEILAALGREVLAELAQAYLELLGTSSALYERSGDYAMGLMSSGWCRKLDAASRELCGTPDNEAAIRSGKWLCHESCWAASRRSIETGAAVDIECAGGIRLYAIPIRAGNDVVGSINFGYGEPPQDEASLRAIAGRYGVDVDELRALAQEHPPEPDRIVEAARKQLHVAGALVGEVLRRTRAEAELEGARRELAASERVSALGSLVSGVAHEVRTPLTYLQTNLHLLARELDALDGGVLDDAARERLSEKIRLCNDGSDRINALIKDLHRFTRNRRQELRQENFGEVIQEAVELFRRTHPASARIATSLQPGPSLLMDRNQIQQIVLNLLENAAAASGPEDEVSVETTVSDGWCEMVVRDRGCGIPQHVQAKMYEPFFTTRTEGTGLGLAIVRRLVELHSGAIACTSEPDQGTAFAVRLPWKPAAEGAA